MTYDDVRDKISLLQLLESKTVCGIQDDHEFWSSNGCEPWAGKPVWVSNHDSGYAGLAFGPSAHGRTHYESKLVSAV